MYQQSTAQNDRGGAGFMGHNPAQQRLLMAARGWHLFPLEPGKKTPYPGSRGYKDATTEPAKLLNWPEGAGVGIATGASNLVVIDLDCHTAEPTKPEHQIWTERGCLDGADVFTWQWHEHTIDGSSWAHTYVVLTPSGGGHLYYRAPAQQIRNSASGRLGWQVDVRAQGGYVVAPGTTLPAGTYTPLWEPATLPVLPEWITNTLTAPKAAPQRPARRVLALPSRAGKRVNALAHQVATAAVGQRNDMLNWAAYQLAKDRALTQEHAQVLFDAAKAAGLAEAEAIATIRSAGKELAAS
ncbi:hypothetical protein CKW39_08645 [Kocuria sp. WRN011]|nr:hypothetical protein CKW39_08645 [Kocuria sp. WRN011]